MKAGRCVQENWTAWDSAEGYIKARRAERAGCQRLPVLPFWGGLLRN